MQYGPRQSTAELDDSLVGRLYQQYALSLMTYIRRYVPTREEAEDILLEVFLAALQHQELAHFGEQRQLAWLQRVAAHKSADYHRRSARHPVVPLEQAAESLIADKRYSPDQLAMRQEEETVLYSRLTRLPQSYQQVLQLRFAQGLRCREIALRMNKSEGAIRMILSRALTLLRDVYPDHKEESV